MRWTLKEAGCGDPTNQRANLWSDEQKLHRRPCMRVRLLNKPKPNNYTELCMVNVADRWRERNVWYPGRSVRYALNGWLYRRIRMCIWKQWKLPQTRMRKLIGLGVDSHYAATIANDRKGYWFNAGNKAVNWALNKERLIGCGYYDLATAYQSMHVNY